MNWYSLIKSAQVAQSVDTDITNAIYQRLQQAERSRADGESAVDDLFGQGFDPSTLETSIQGAVRLIVGDSGDETMLSPAQQSVLMILRAQIQSPSTPGLLPEPIDAPQDQPIGEEWGA